MSETRCQRLAQQMPQGFEAALITTESNRFYFLDLDTWDAGTLLIFPDESVFLIDPRYLEIAQQTVKTARVEEETNALQQVAQLLRARGVKRLYVEDEVTVGYAACLREVLAGITVDVSDTLTMTVRRMRQLKDAQEVDRMRRAQKITDDCFTYICGKVRPGAREIDLALEMETFMRSHGASGLAFATIFVSGKKTSLPHGEPGEKVIEDGDFVTMDFGAKWGGYCTDMTRTVAVGSVSDEMEHVYNTVLEAQKTCCAMIHAGMKGIEVDAIARNIIADAGYAGRFGHGLGHSVGIDIHEDPRCSPRDASVLQPGMLMTIEPGIYLPGKFGVRIEDTVLLTETGCEILGKSDKNLILL
ncbi:MAG: aminopeptidase P family protein [Pygmaiobacter sp.]|nr:aminopeptidase P family protein [Pygmaiobacter sp.]